MEDRDDLDRRPPAGGRHDDRRSDADRVGAAMAKYLPIGVGMGIALGAGVGIAIDNLALGLGVGTALGAGLSGVAIAADDEPRS